MKCQFKYKHLIASWEVPTKVELLTEYSEVVVAWEQKPGGQEERSYRW